MYNLSDLLTISNSVLLKRIKKAYIKADKLYNKTFMITAREDETYSEWMAHQNKDDPKIRELIQAMDYKNRLYLEIKRRSL